MTHCIVCKVYNTSQEASRHPNWNTIWWARHFRRVLMKREFDSELICYEHTIPQRLTSTLTEAGKMFDKAFDALVNYVEGRKLRAATN